MVFILFLGGTISKYLGESGQGHFVYDFELLSGLSQSLANVEQILMDGQVLLASSMATR